MRDPGTKWYAAVTMCLRRSTSFGLKTGHGSVFSRPGQQCAHRWRKNPGGRVAGRPAIDRNEKSRVRPARDHLESAHPRFIASRLGVAYILRGAGTGLWKTRTNPFCHRLSALTAIIAARGINQKRVDSCRAADVFGASHKTMRSRILLLLTHAPTASISVLAGSTCSASSADDGSSNGKSRRRCCATRTVPSCSSS